VSYEIVNVIVTEIKLDYSRFCLVER